MIKTLLRPYDEHPGGRSQQAVTYYFGPDVQAHQLLELPLDSNRLGVNADEMVKLLPWLPSKLHSSSYEIIKNFKTINVTASNIYNAHATFRLGGSPKNDQEVMRRHWEMETLTTGLRSLIDQIHFCFSTIFWVEYVRLKGPEVPAWPAIYDLRSLYEEVEKGNPEALDLQKAIFGHGIYIEPLVVEMSILHTLQSSMNMYSSTMYMGSEFPTIVIIGPHPGKANESLTHNHAVAQIMAGANNMIETFGCFNYRQE